MTPCTRHFCPYRNLPHKAATPALFPTDWRREALGDWVARQYRTLALPDARLEKRLLTVAQTLAAKPHDSINQACDNWAGAKGAYRFVENEAVTPHALIQPLTDAAAREAAAHGAVISVQDTTALSFPRARQAKGLGPVNDCAEARGMLVHPALALRPDGAPLGLLDLQYWCRDPHATQGGDAARKASRPIEEKESAKWLRGIAAARRALEANVAEAQRPRLIHVFDREGDIHEVFDLVTAGGDGAVIRCGQDRRVVTGNGRQTLAHTAIAAAPVLGRAVIEVPRKQGQAKRQAMVEIRACNLTLIPPLKHRAGAKRRRAVALRLVQVAEVNPPRGLKEPLHWLLWTTEPVATMAQALEIVGLYKLRWKIEEFNLVLKSGCRIEDLQFETAERLAKVVALYAPVAVRILQLRAWSRLEPEAPCTLVLTNEQWRALWTYIHRRRPSRHTAPPSIKQATLWIGRLGGHLGRKSDGMPGVRTLWRGWRDLDLLVTMFILGDP